MKWRLVTNPGSNLTPAMIARYRVVLSPQHILVDGVDHDTREPIALSQVDRWVAEAREHPHVVGSSAAEMAHIFKQLVQDGESPLVLTTSQKIIRTYHAAQTAARLVDDVVAAGATIHIVDCGLTDLGVALPVLMAGEALAAGRDGASVLALLKAYAGRARMVWTLESLDYAVKGGRVSGLRAFLANVLRVRPLLAFVDGETVTTGKIKADADPGPALLDQLEATIPRGSRVWLAVLHGDSPDKAASLTQQAGERYEVVFQLVAPLSPSIYLYAGRGTVGLAAVAVADLPFEPPVPSPGF